MSFLTNRARDAWDAWLGAMSSLQEHGTNLIEGWHDLADLEDRARQIPDESVRAAQLENIATARARLESATNLYQSVRSKVLWLGPQLAAVVEYFLPGHTVAYPSAQLPAAVAPGGVGFAVTVGSALLVLGTATAVVASVATVGYLVGRAGSQLKKTESVLASIERGAITPGQGIDIIRAGGSGLPFALGGSSTLLMLGGGLLLWRLYGKRRRR